MMHFDLLLTMDGKPTLESFAQTFYSAIGVTSYQEKESSHYVDGHYFVGELDGIIFKVMLSDDEDHSDLPFWVRINLGDQSGMPFDLDSLVSGKLLGSGFRVAQIIDIGQVNERRCDFGLRAGEPC